MKFILVIVLVFVLLTVHGRDLPGYYGGLDSGATVNPNTAVLDFKPTKNEAYSFYIKPAAGYIAQRKAGSKCKAQDICIIMGGSCVNDASLCQGRLIPGCKGKNCKCCVYGNLETMIKNLEQEIQTIRDNLNIEIQKLKENLTDSNSNLNDEFGNLNDNLDEEFKSLENNITDSNSILDEEFKNLKDDLEKELKNLENNLTGANANLNEEFENLKDNLEEEIDNLKGELTHGNSKLSKEFENMNDNISKSLYSLQLNMDLMMGVCPVGSFQTAGSKQCYKFYYDKFRTWEEADQKCRDEGMVMAEPLNSLSLRKYMTETFVVENVRSAYCWIGARGTGSAFKMQRSGQVISKTDPLWWPGHPNSVETSKCIVLLAHTYNLPKYPNQPYSMNDCASRVYYTLCEYIRMGY